VGRPAGETRLRRAGPVFRHQLLHGLPGNGVGGSVDHHLGAGRRLDREAGGGHGFFFTLALHLQDGLGYSALRAGLTFAPTAAAFALVSLNWRRLPARWHGALIIGGFVAFGAAMAALAAVGVILAAIRVLERRLPA
jgi:hypothetical protein